MGAGQSLGSPGSAWSRIACTGARSDKRARRSTDGDPLAAEVQGNALPGFGEAARLCAMAESFKPALDAAGKRIASETGLLVVHFVR